MTTTTQVGEHKLRIEDTVSVAFEDGRRAMLGGEEVNADYLRLTWVYEPETGWYVERCRLYYRQIRANGELFKRRQSTIIDTFVKGQFGREIHAAAPTITITIHRGVYA